MASVRPSLEFPETIRLSPAIVLAAALLFAAPGATPALAQWDDVPDPCEYGCRAVDDGYNEGGGTFGDDGYYKPYFDDWYDSDDSYDSYDDSGSYDSYDSYDGYDSYDSYEEPYYEEPYYEEHYYEPGAKEIAAEHYNAGNVLIDQGDFWGAEQEFREARAYNPNDAWAWTKLGDVLEQQGRYEEAVDAYWEATMADPDDQLAWDNYTNLNAWLEEQRTVDEWNAGLDLLDQERWADAEYYFRQATEHDPYNVAAHQNLDYALFQQGRHAESTAADRRAFALAPDNPQLRENLFHSLDWHAWQLGNDGATFEAAAAFSEAIGLAGSDAEWQEILHDDLTKLYDTASFSADLAGQETYAGLLLALDPNEAVSHQRLGQVFMAQGNIADAREAYESAIALAPEDDMIYLDLGERLFDARAHDQALGVFVRTAAIPGITAEGKAAIQGFIGLAHHRMGDYEAALTALEKLILLDPDEPFYYVLMDRTLADAGAHGAAEKAFEAALMFDPNNADAAQGHAALGGAGGGTTLGEAGASAPFDWGQPNTILRTLPSASDKGGEASAAGQLSGLGDALEETSPGAARAGGEEAPKSGARIGFDDAGQLGGEIDTSTVEVPAGGAMFVLESIPEPVRTPQVVALVEKGREIQEKIEEKKDALAEIPHNFSNSMAIVTLKDEIAKDVQELASVSFSLQSMIAAESA